ncbi:MAG: glycosyltransferase family 2 protein [Candidatus Binatia bacterium]
MEPKVTVIIPAYNRERYIGEAVASVLAQTAGDLELLVVDDGSTDGTAAVVAGIADPRVRLLSGAHQGISAAMNRGVAAARGTYLARCDSDDMWLPDLLATLLPVLEATPGLAAASGRGETTDAGGRPTGRLLGTAPRFRDDALCSLLWDDFTCNIATVARRSCVEAIGGYDESLPANEDWDLWLRLARRAPIAWVDRVLAHARSHDGNTTGLGSPLFRQTQESRERVLEKVFADDRLPPAAAAMRPAAFASLYLRSGLHWLAAGERRAALRQFRRAMAVSGAPTTTLVRIVWRIASIRLLDRLPAGRRFLAWQSRIRRQWRDLQPRHT